MSVQQREKRSVQSWSVRPSWSSWSRTALVVALGFGMAGAVMRAGTTKFWEKRKALSAELKAEQERLGLAGRANQKALYAQYPTPEITLCKPVLVAPGATASIALTGQFPEKTTFLVANDHVELGEGALAAGRYTAKATVAADAGPAFAPVYAFAPVSGANNSCAPIFVGPVVGYELKSNDGWTVKLTPQAKAFELSAQEAKLPYLVAFFKEGETAPFKKMTSTLTINRNGDPSRAFDLSLTAAPADGSPEAELAAIQKKMSDPQAFAKLPPKEMDRLVKRMTELTEAQLKTVTDPSYAQKSQQAQDDFGCNSLTLTVTGTTATGRAICGKNVGTRGELKLTGAATPMS